MHKAEVQIQYSPQYTFKWPPHQEQIKRYATFKNYLHGSEEAHSGSICSGGECCWGGVYVPSLTSSNCPE